MTRTLNSRFWYWLGGSVLVWLTVPAQLVNIMASPTWFAVNPACDSLGFVIMQYLSILPFWSAISLVVSLAFLSIFLIGRRVSVSVFSLSLGSPTKNVITTGTVLILSLPMAYDLLTYFWEVAVPQVISSDCNGRAELVSATMRRPIVQLSPIIDVLLLLWLGHIRALFLAPKAPIETA